MATVVEIYQGANGLSPARGYGGADGETRPTDALGINWSHCLARNLEECCPMQQMPGLNFGRSGNLTNNGALSVGTSNGLVVETNGSSTFLKRSSIPPGISGATKATLAGWMYRAASGTTASFGYSKTSGVGFRFNIEHYSDDVIYIPVGNFAGPGNEYASLVGMAVSEWHHYAAVFDGTQSTDATRILMYFDGVQRSLTFGAGGIATSLATSMTFFSVGLDDGGSGDRYWAGRYKDVFAWSRALSPNEVQGLYRRTLLEDFYK